MATDCCEAIVWRTGERDQVHFRGWLIDGHFARVADGDFEEGGTLLCHLYRCAVSPKRMMKGYGGSLDGIERLVGCL